MTLGANCSARWYQKTRKHWNLFPTSLLVSIEISCFKSSFCMQKAKNGESFTDYGWNNNGSPISMEDALPEDVTDLFISGEVNREEIYFGGRSFQRK